MPAGNPLLLGATCALSETKIKLYDIHSLAHSSFRQHEGGNLNSSVATEWQHFVENVSFRGNP
jgi:hypothetical protein